MEERGKEGGGEWIKSCPGKLWWFKKRRKLSLLPTAFLDAAFRHEKPSHLAKVQISKTFFLSLSIFPLTSDVHPRSSR